MKNMIHNKEYNDFRYKWVTEIRKNNKYYPLLKLNKFIQRKWIQYNANKEYSKYKIEYSNKPKITFNDDIDIREFDKDLPSNLV